MNRFPTSIYRPWVPTTSRSASTAAGFLTLWQDKRDGNIDLYMRNHFPGDSCPPDANNDGVVNIVDLLEVISAWGPCPGCDADTNGDDVVNILDLLEVISGWGPCP